MGMSRDNGMTRLYGDYGSYGLSPGAAYGQGGGSVVGRSSDDPRYAYNEDSLKSAMNLDEVTALTDQIKGYGDDLFSIFDRYQDNFDYLGENAGVSEGELQSRLGQSSSNYLAQADAQQQSYERDMQRMGINPNSAKFAGFGTSQALQKAAGLSLTQNQVRDSAREESWNENMQVAGLGLNAGNAGLNAVNTAAGLYGKAGQLFSDQKLKYDSLNENSRQFDKQYGLAKKDQAFNQAAERWNSGVIQNNDNGWSSKKSSYGFAF